MYASRSGIRGCGTLALFAIWARIERQFTNCGAVRRLLAKGRIWEGTHFLRLQREKPHPTITRGAGR